MTKKQGTPQDGPQKIKATVETAAGPEMNAEEQFRIEKAHGELLPLVRFLKSATPREKLIGVAVEVLGFNTVRETLDEKGCGLYDGDIDLDLIADWQRDVFEALGTEGEYSPEERYIAAYLAGLAKLTRI